MSLALFAGNAIAVGALMVALWIVSVVRRDASVVDPWWSIGFLLVTGWTAWRTGVTPGKTVLLVAVSAWALRLWLHLLVRSRGKAEDPRYAAFRRRFGPERYWWVSFFQVFLLQGVLMLIISAPLQLAAAAPAPDPVSMTDIAGAAVATVGFAFEAIADAQLAAFRRDSSKRGKVLDTGLWRWSRHPNYFGEALIGWGFWAMALDQPYGAATVFAPALMTFLLLRVSGVTMLDAHMLATKPDYAAYVQRTSAFLPRAPRGSA
jgi:steroid 5-alpha reductase family enzyme